jgi:hypothetical protein
MNKKPIINNEPLTTHQILYKIYNKVEAERIKEEKELKAKNK